MSLNVFEQVWTVRISSFLMNKYLSTHILVIWPSPPASEVREVVWINGSKYCEHLKMKKKNYCFQFKKKKNTLKKYVEPGYTTYQQLLLLLHNTTTTTKIIKREVVTIMKNQFYTPFEIKILYIKSGMGNKLYSRWFCKFLL